MPSDNALCSSSALIISESLAKSAGNFTMERRSRGQWFKSTLLHISVSRFSDITEYRSKSARVRAIRDRARTRRAPWSAQIRRIGQNLSGRDSARSVDHRHTFAHGGQAGLYAYVANQPTDRLDSLGLFTWPGLVCNLDCAIIEGVIGMENPLVGGLGGVACSEYYCDPAPPFPSCSLPTASPNPQPNAEPTPDPGAWGPYYQAPPESYYQAPPSSSDEISAPLGINSR
jgi:hypothetical protein